MDRAASRRRSILLLQGRVTIACFARFSKGKVHDLRGTPFVAGQKAVPSRPQSGIIVSTLKAIAGVLRAGFQIVQVLALVDRHEGGREALQKSGYERSRSTPPRIFCASHAGHPTNSLHTLLKKVTKRLPTYKKSIFDTLLVSIYYVIFYGTKSEQVQGVESIALQPLECTIASPWREERSSVHY